MKTTAILHPDGASFTLARGAWANTYPLADLPKWIAFYRRQAELVPGQTCYVDDVQALEGLKKDTERLKGEGSRLGPVACNGNGGLATKGF